MSSKNRGEKAGKNNKVVKLTNLTAEQKGLWDGFITYEKERDMKDMDKKVFHLSRFFSYVNSMGIDIYELGFKGAQEFQTYLSTLENEDNRPYYATLTVKSIISMVSRFYAYLRYIGKVYTNPFLGIKKIKTGKRLPQNIPHEKKMNEILEELSRFLEHENIRDKRMYYKAHVMAELMYATGMRIREVLELKEEDIDFVNRIITVKKGKGGKERIAYLNDYAARVLRIYINEMKEVINMNKGSATIFGVADKSTMTVAFHKRLKKVFKKHGIGKYTSHSFRHTLGFHLLKRGCDLRYIQLILGHEDMNTTTIYTKVDKESLKSELDAYHPRQFTERQDGNT